MKVHKFIKIYDNVDVMITPTKYLKEKLQRNGFDKNKICHIPTFSNEKENNTNKVGDYGLYFGRISEEKGVKYVVKAYEKLDQNHKLKIMGDDTTEEAKKIKQYIEEKHITNIELLGFKEGMELEAVIKNSKFVLVPSIWYENLPNTILEAFSYAKPVIATNIGSLSETIEDGKNGYLFELGNVEQLKEKILKLDNDELVRKIGKNNIETLRENYSLNNHYKKLISIFQGLL